MRNEEIIRNYFDYYIHRRLARNSHLPVPKETPRVSKEGSRYPDPPVSTHAHLGLNGLVKKQSQARAEAKDQPESTEKSTRDTEVDCRAEAIHWDTEVDEVVLVRKLAPLASLRDRRLKVLRQLEVVSARLPARGGCWH